MSAANFFEAIAASCSVSPSLIAKWVIQDIMPDVKKGIWRYVYINGAIHLAAGPNFPHEEIKCRVLERSQYDLR
jgi:hypothetical protein